MRRERHKAARKQSILDAAASLIRERENVDFPMRLLADKADVSPATPYNVFGSKAAIMYALLNQSMDQVAENGELAHSRTDAFEQVVEAARGAAQVFADDPGFYRPLYQFLLGVRDPARPAFMDRGLAYWKGSVLSLQRLGYFEAPITLEAFARALEIQFAGVLDLWVQDELRNNEFPYQAIYITALLLLGIADDEARPTLLAYLDEARRQLPTGFTFRRAAAANRSIAERA